MMDDKEIQDPDAEQLFASLTSASL